MTVVKPPTPTTARHLLGRSWCVVGGAGFIGSHAVDAIIDEFTPRRVVVVDNLASGSRSRIARHLGDPRVQLLQLDVSDRDALVEAVHDTDLVIHLAANPDIARAATDPDVDFRDGTVLARNVFEAARQAQCTAIAYASGSGVYGDVGGQLTNESYGPLVPISTYGASKLAGEALLSAYAHMFGMRGMAYRFANVIGPRQTHGVAYDFIRQLLTHPEYLIIQGDGNQSKPYIHVTDVIRAVLNTICSDQSPFRVFNVGVDDYLTVTEIAGLVVEALALKREAVEFRYTGGARGWAGDVPVVRLDSSAIRQNGWVPTYSSVTAMRATLPPLIDDARADKRQT